MSKWHCCKQLTWTKTLYNINLHLQRTTQRNQTFCINSLTQVACNLLCWTMLHKIHLMKNDQIKLQISTVTFGECFDGVAFWYSITQTLVPFVHTPGLHSEYYRTTVEGYTNGYFICVCLSCVLEWGVSECHTGKQSLRYKWKWTVYFLQIQILNFCSFNLHSCFWKVQTLNCFAVIKEKSMEK